MTSEPPSPPHVSMPTETIAMEDNDQLLWIDGALPLPIGTVIQLDNMSGMLEQAPLDPARFLTGRADAVVTGIRISGTQSSTPTIILDVELLRAGSSPASEWNV